MLGEVEDAPGGQSSQPIDLEPSGHNAGADIARNDFRIGSWVF
jgi:hypothetical protein